jgi:hypothetical protein
MILQFSELYGFSNPSPTSHSAVIPLDVRVYGTATQTEASVQICDSVNHYREPGSSVSVVCGYGLGGRPIEVRSSAEAKGFFL